VERADGGPVRSCALAGGAFRRGGGRQCWMGLVFSYYVCLNSTTCILFLVTLTLAPWRWAPIQPAIRQVLLGETNGRLGRPHAQCEKGVTMLASIAYTFLDILTLPFFLLS
jgi:hypothetical protein